MQHTGFKENWGGPRLMIHPRKWYRVHFQKAHL